MNRGGTESGGGGGEGRRLPGAMEGGGAAEKVEGLVEIVTFHSEETGFCVLKVRARGFREPVAVTGKLPRVNAGEWVKAEGHWKIDRVHGRQLAAEKLEAVVPNSAEGLEKFLGSGLIKGIGPVYAKKLMEHFGTKVLEVIEQRSAELEEVEGIGPLRRRRIKESWEAQKSVREIMTFLYANGVGTGRAFRIYKTYGTEAVEKIRLDPYGLARDVRGIGFLTADQIAMRLGVERDSVMRARAGLEYMLQEAEGQGHCAMPHGELVARTAKGLGIGEERVAEALREEVREGRLTAGAGPSGASWIYLTGLYLAEREVAGRLKELAGGRHPYPGLDAEAALAWVEKRQGMQLGREQREAFRGILREKTAILTGGPGVGKTTLIRALVEVVAAKKMRLALCAPTGRAAKRMAEVSGREAKTLHRALEYAPATGKFQRDASNPLEADVVIVDEFSMVDVEMARSLLRAVPWGGQLILVGDVDQLPSVGPGAVLADLIASGCVPVHRLNEVFRQGGGSSIVENSHRIRAGEMPVLPEKGAGGDFYFVEAETPERGVEMIRRLVCERIPARWGMDPLRDVQVLTPMQKGELGARNLNTVLQAALNPHGKGVARFGWEFREGDRVMQMENDYDKDVFNGDTGRVERVDEREGELTVRFEERLVTYDFQELDELAPAYATTVHKSQGSEYPCVVMPVHTQHYVMLQRNLIYTGITRGKKLVVLVGTRRALGMAVGNADAGRRNTTLCVRVREEFGVRGGTGG